MEVMLADLVRSENGKGKSSPARVVPDGPVASCKYLRETRLIVADTLADCDACERDGVLAGHRDGCVARFLRNDHWMPFRVFSPLQKLKNNCGDLGLPVSAVQLMKPWAVVVMSALQFAS